MELMTKQIEVYEYHELSDKAKDEVRISLIQNWEEPEHIIEYAKEEGVTHGFCIDDIRYSVGCGQGDGASWTGSINLIEFFEKHPDAENIGEENMIIELMRNDWIASTAEVVQLSFRYPHSGSMELGDVADYCEDVDSDEVAQHLAVGIMEGAVVKEIFECFHWARRLDYMLDRAIKACRDYANTIYQQLKEDYEYQISDENIEELIYINGWRFDINGKFI